jgi:indole-3-glycerol phosphate synthase/phosphoribosylanthranilate isomerase
VSIPVLCKDFVVDPYQVYEARRHGADAILLMASVLKQAELIRCLQVAGKLTMDALVEVRDIKELARALDAGAMLVGINNRDLDTLQVNLETTERLAPRVPCSVTLISESGIRDHKDLRRLSPLVDGLLVGSAMMRHPSPERAARQLAFGRIKICGLTRRRDARQAWQLGATWGGLILAPESPRALSQDRAAALRRSCPELRWAGVFVNESPRAVVRAAKALQLDAVQLHGEEPPDHVAAIVERLPTGCEVWKACRVLGRLPRMEQTDARRILLDTHSDKRRGGTGSTFDWSLLHGMTCSERRRIILAGGIGPDNVAEADARELWALDVNSGVEDAPGKKSRPKLDLLFSKLRGERRSDDQRKTP